MIHPDMFPKTIVNVDVKSVEVKYDVKPGEVNDDVQPDEVNDDVKPDARPIVVEVDVRANFTNNEVFIVHEHMLQWVRREDGNWGLVL